VIIPAPRVNLDELAREMRAAFDTDATGVLDAVTELRDTFGHERSLAIVATLWEAAQRSFLRLIAENMEAHAPDPDQYYEFAASLRPKMPITRDKDDIMSLEIGFTMGASRERAMERFAEPLRLGLAGPTICRVVVQPLARQPRLPDVPEANTEPDGQLSFDELVAGIGDEADESTDTEVPTDEPAEHPSEEDTADDVDANTDADEGRS